MEDVHRLDQPGVVHCPARGFRGWLQSRRTRLGTFTQQSAVLVLLRTGCESFAGEARPKAASPIPRAPSMSPKQRNALKKVGSGSLSLFDLMRLASDQMQELLTPLDTGPPVLHLIGGWSAEVDLNQNGRFQKA